VNNTGTKKEKIMK